MVYAGALLVSIVIDNHSRAGSKIVLVIIPVMEVDRESSEGKEGIWGFEPYELSGAKGVRKVA